MPYKDNLPVSNSMAVMHTLPVTVCVIPFKEVSISLRDVILIVERSHMGYYKTYMHMVLLIIIQMDYDYTNNA